jgi:hypothetical protein
MEHSVNVQAKKMLAKILATESITIVHAGVRTATFDPKNRILTLPIWKDMTGDLYDLLILHEVSHALYTPKGTKELIDACVYIDPQYPMAARRFINIVEDARIERLIKVTYPGGKMSFIRGYEELIERDFFGTKSRNLDSFGIIDRLNIYFKSGNTEISFNDKELEFISEIEKALTFNEVVDISKKLYQYAKEERSEKKKQEEEKKNQQKIEDEEGTIISEDENDDITVDPDSEPADSEGGESGESKEGKDEKDSEDNKADETSENKKSKQDPNASEDSKAAEDFEAPVEAVTDQTWEKSQEKLCDNEARPIKYIGIPKPKLKEIVVPYKQVHKEIRKFYESNAPNIKQHKEEFERFKQENKPVVDWLFKEFELHKSADQYSRIKIGKTGILNLNRLNQYKFSDDIMRKVVTVPGGKNHVLKIFVDWSGSMRDHVLGTVHQLINVIMFARKAQIDYDVYLFGSQKFYSQQKKYYSFIANLDVFEHKENDFAFYCGYSLPQIFSNKMTPLEFNDACVNMFLMASGVNSGVSSINGKNQMKGLPTNYCMGGTPLNETIITAIDLINSSRKESQINNIIFITDGDATTHDRYCIDELGNTNYIDYGKEDIYLRDQVTHMDYKLSGDTMYNTKQFLEILKNRTGINVVGFFICGSNEKEIISNLCGKSQTDQFEKELKEKNFVIVPDNGYTEFYLIKGGKELKIKLSKESINSSIGMKQLLTNLTEYGLEQRKQRVVLTRFIKLIA